MSSEHVDYAESVLRAAEIGAEMWELIRPCTKDTCDILLLRPQMTYDMSSAILTKGGYDTGATFVGHSDFLLGDDVVSKLHYGNFTFYSKAVVTNPKNVIIARNIYCNGYKRGNNCKFAREEADLKKGASLISVIIPAKMGNKLPNPLDATGAFNSSYEQNRGNKDTELHFPKACGNALLAKFPSFMDDQADLSTNQDLFLERMHSVNTVCYRGHQFSYDIGTQKMSAVTVNTGHWGPNVYPGCGRARAGEMKYLEKQNYQNSVTV